MIAPQSTCLRFARPIFYYYFLLGQAEEVPGDRGPPGRPQELRPPEGQAFLWHRQVC